MWRCPGPLIPPAVTEADRLSRPPAKPGVQRRIEAAVIATQAQDRLKQEGN